MEKEGRADPECCKEGGFPRAAKTVAGHHGKIGPRTDHSEEIHKSKSKKFKHAIDYRESRA